eukprot:364595_1
MAQQLEEKKVEEKKEYVVNSVKSISLTNNLSIEQGSGVDDVVLAHVGRVALVASHSAKVIAMRAISGSNPGQDRDVMALQFTWTTDGSLNQQWDIIQIGDTDTFIIRNAYTTFVLDIRGGKAAQKAKIVQNAYTGLKTQQWKLDKSNGNGYIAIKSVDNEAYCLDVSEASTNDGAELHCYKFNKTKANQLFGMIDNSIPITNIAIICGCCDDDTGMMCAMEYSKKVQTPDGTQYKPVKQSQWKGGTGSQKFNLVGQDSSYYKIQNVKDDRLLTAAKDKSTGTYKVVGYKDLGSKSSQLWTLTNLTPGGWEITNKLTGTLLSLEGNCCGEDMDIILEKRYKNGADYQTWGFRDNGDHRIVYVNKHNLDTYQKALQDWYDKHPTKNQQYTITTQKSKNDLYSLFYFTASGGVDDGLIYVCTAEAETGIMHIVSDQDNPVTSVDVSIFNARVDAWFGVGKGKFGIGFGASVNLITIQASFFYCNLGVGVDTGIGIKDDSLTMQVLGCGFTIGRKIGISVGGSSFGVDLGNCSIM